MVRIHLSPAENQERTGPHRRASARSGIPRALALILIQAAASHRNLTEAEPSRQNGAGRRVYVRGPAASPAGCEARAVTRFAIGVGTMPNSRRLPVPAATLSRSISS